MFAVAYPTALDWCRFIHLLAVYPTIQKRARNERTVGLTASPKDQVEIWMILRSASPYCNRIAGKSTFVEGVHTYPYLRCRIDCVSSSLQYSSPRNSGRSSTWSRVFAGVVISLISLSSETSRSRWVFSNSDLHWTASSSPFSLK